MRNRDQSLLLPTVVTCGVIITASLCTSVLKAGTAETAATIPAADDALATLMENIKVVREKKPQITWYSPKFQPYSSYDFRVYPIIGQSDQGWRKIGLQITLKDPPKGRPESVHAVLDGEPWIIPIAESKDISTYDSGCRVTQTVLLQNQESFVQGVTAAREVVMSLEGYRHAVRYKLTQEDRENFRRILTLWKMKTLPATKEEPSSSSPPPDGNLPGKDDVTNPEIISRTKVQPRFPKIAQGKNVLGRVVLRAVVRRDGTVGNIEVLKEAGGDCGFEAAAIEAVRQWRYKPGTKDGNPVDVYFTIVVDFTYGDYRMAPG